MQYLKYHLPGYFPDLSVKTDDINFFIFAIGDSEHAKLLLDPLGFGKRDPQADAQVVGEVIAPRSPVPWCAATSHL